MAYTFNGTTKIISLSNVTTLDIRDLYSRWKEWVISDGAGFLPAFQVIGGDPIDVSKGIYITSYFFLINGWKIKPQESNHKLTVTGGVLLTIDGTDPFIPTNGNYNVLIQYSQPIKTETVSTSGGGSGYTLAQIANAVWSEVLSSYTTNGMAGQLITLMKKMIYNRVVKDGNIVTIYQDDGQTVWKQFDLSDGGRVEYNP